MKRLQRFLARFLQSLSFAAFILCITGVVILETLGRSLLIRLYEINTLFAQSSGRNGFSLLVEMGSGALRSQTQSYPTHRYLLLGTDEVVGSHRQDVLTDTIILVTYQPEENVLRLLSFPRDIYLPEYQMKINALYASGLESASAHPERIVGEAVESMIGQPIDGEIVLSLAQVQDLIDRVGGVPVEVTSTFTDERFPRAGVDVSAVRDPAILYETIHFDQGWQVMDGQTAVKYMRSRHANELEQQGDQARMRRQKQVIQAVAQHLFRPEIIGNPVVLGSLYDWYADNFMAKISLYDLGWLGGSLAQKQLPQMQTVTLPVTEYAAATDEATLFVHPPDAKYRQWAYESVDPTWQKLHDFVIHNGL